ncbi:CGNR zinc finger domain-containing protein [Hyphomicrobium sp. 802]|uniref:CGNR zinc finger domain-containing protein n=1 Tax=Hyphomicrobium sp. 802 TaxID=1112272 RepID=UPI00045E5B01|nr:CGNR zinc finger domain-containing protein [Hyphomicrobium sp. 802]
MSDQRPPAMFIADAPGLDFLNSIGMPFDETVEWITNGDDLLAWLTSAKFISPEIGSLLRKNSVPGELDAAAAQARSFREWFRGFIYEYKGRPLKRGALQKLGPLNHVLSRDEEFGQIVVTTDSKGGKQGRSELAWLPERRWRSPESLLLPIAKAFGDVICYEDFRYIKKCESPTCTMLFVDKTRAHTRRWCSMALCGNRAKQAAHRERVRGE